MPLLWVSPSLSNDNRSGVAARNESSVLSPSERHPDELLCDVSVPKVLASSLMNFAVSVPAPFGTEVDFPTDPELIGRCLLIVFSGGRARRRLMHSLKLAGVRLVCYATQTTPWAQAYIPSEDWIIGPASDSLGAQAAVEEWLQKERSEQKQSNLAINDVGAVRQNRCLPGGASSSIFDGVICYDEYGLQLTATLANAFGIPHHTSPQVVEAMRSKWLFRKACEAAGVSGPHFAHLELSLPNRPQPSSQTQSPSHQGSTAEESVPQHRDNRGELFTTGASDELNSSAVHHNAVITPHHDSESGDQYDHLLYHLTSRLNQAHVSFPVVAKPIGCGGSYSVTRANNIHELAASYDSFRDGLPTYLEEFSLSPNSLCATGGMLVEELLSGQEVDIDCVVLHGQLLFACISDNHPCKQQQDCPLVTFMEAGGRCPSILPYEAQVSLLELTSKVTSMFGLGLTGVLHFEAMYDHETKVAAPIELNGRIGGAETYSNIMGAWGVDLARAAARVACGLLPELPAGLRLQLNRGPGCPKSPMWAIRSHAPIQYGAEGFHVATRYSEGASEWPPTHLAHSLDAYAVEQPRVTADDASIASDQKLGVATVLTTKEKEYFSLAAKDEVHSDEGAQHNVKACQNKADSNDHKCECLESCCCKGRCCYWDFLSGTTVLLPRHLPTSDVASDVYCMSEPVPESHHLVDCTCQCVQKALSSMNKAAEGDGDAAFGQTVNDKGALPYAMESSAEELLVDPESRRVDVEDVLCRSCIVDLHPAAFVHSCNFVPDWTGLGIVEKLEVGSEALKHAGYVDSEVSYCVGAVAAMPPLGFGCLGWMVVKSETGPQEAEAVMTELLGYLDMRLRPVVD
ncbi:hypothetical protein CEUSTIGMA_g10679.t1 [Chlamydomonas eustigma]|uniref:ATP-grasp domain-containing protein n=1 Tax=Chlamydomonas eustigma TaxID=1157962 RepID=A0A250XJP3_9CHLO|nr:hypothetical protein CEUSTIGMA_g10679.t1 [Chlamydomonas eustigma]|eukprot:GAX83253.1 hypothetical protein CEUSTIGMA_g10679.t1 [Chlamydomonas eustigma]